MRIFRFNAVLSIQFKRPLKCLTKLIKEMKRSAEEGNMSSYRFTAGKTRYRLIDYRLKYGSGKIFFRCFRNCG